MVYTERVDGFQICDPSYWPGLEPAYLPPRFDVVKWYQHEPVVAYNMNSKTYETTTESCYVVATLIWDAHEPAFDFKSIGMRWLESDPSKEVIKMVTDFAKDMGKKLDEVNDEIISRSSWTDRTNADDTEYKWSCPFCKSVTNLLSKHCPTCGRRVYSPY